jgi:molecular chaperone DnaK
MSTNHFSPIIERNTPLPVSQTEIYSTVMDNQDAAEIRIFQGENPDTRYDTLVGEFMVEGLAEVPRGNQIMVRLDLDLNGILKVTATERATGLAKHVVIDNAMERFRKRQRSDAVDRLETILGTIQEPPGVMPGLPPPAPAEAGSGPTAAAEELDPALRQAIESAQALAAKAERLLPSANEEDARELQSMLADLRSAIQRRAGEDIRAAMRELEDLVFYLEET